YESSYYTESEAESDYVTHEEAQHGHFNHTLDVEDILREHVDVTTKNAIGLNQHYKAKLIELRTQLEGLLSRCRNRLSEVEKSLDDVRLNLTPKPRPVRPRHPGYICGQPFFKDHELYPGPHNEDYLYRKKVQREFFPLDLFETTESLWTRKDKHVLKSSIQTQAQEFLQRENDLRQKQCNNSENAERIRQERMELSMLSFDDIWRKAHAYDGKYGRLNFTVDWLKISNTVLNGRHSAAACEGMWNNYLLPGLKRSMWTPEEETKLVEAAEAHKLHHWSQIALRVQDRSEYQCFVHYQTNFSEIVQSKKRPWTQEEDELLMRLVDENRIGNNVIWNKIVERMPYRNKVQVYHRYRYTLQQPLRGAKFTAEEDCVIMAYVQQYGDDFRFFSDETLPGRSTKQVWSRYMNTLRFVNRHVGWNLEEDKRLMSYIAEHLTEEGPQKISWAHCSSYLGNHSRLSCRTRYYTIERFLEKNPEATLEDVPRRGKKKLSSKVTGKNWIKTIVDIKNASKGGARNVGHGHETINLSDSDKPSPAEWSLYEQMKFCFRYKFGHRLTVEAKQTHIFTGTKMFLCMLEGFHPDCKGKAFPSRAFMLNSKDKAVLAAVMKSPLDWLNLVSLMCPKMTVVSESQRLFSRIPPNYNTVLGLRGVCLNACSEQTKDVLPELKLKRSGKLDQEMYDQTMATFVERFEAIFHWTILLMMLNIDDVTLENDATTAKKAYATNSNVERNLVGSSIPATLNCIQEYVDPETHLNSIIPVVMELNDQSYTEQMATFASFTPIADESNENNLKLVTNITIIDPKDLPVVAEYKIKDIRKSDQPTLVHGAHDLTNDQTINNQKLKNEIEIKSKTATQQLDAEKKGNLSTFPVNEGMGDSISNERLLIAQNQQHQTPSVTSTTTKRKPSKARASKPRITTKKETSSEIGQQNENGTLPENYPRAIVGYELMDNAVSEQPSLSVKRKPRQTKSNKLRKFTKKVTTHYDGQFKDNVNEKAATMEQPTNNLATQNVTTFTIMEVAQPELHVHNAAAHVTFPQKMCLRGNVSNSIYDGQMGQDVAGYDNVHVATAEHVSVMTDSVSQVGSITHVLDLSRQPTASKDMGCSSYCQLTDVPFQSAAVCEDNTVIDNSQYLPENVGKLTIISNGRVGTHELEGLIVTEREIKVPSGQIAFEGNFIAYSFADYPNPERGMLEMLRTGIDIVTHDTDFIVKEGVGSDPTVQIPPTEIDTENETKILDDSKDHLNLELLNGMDPGQVTAVDIIRMLRTGHAAEDSDDETETEDVRTG
uniref:snRNA-activating protein complex subunit 4 n=1 Tax=Anopheles epiroticus TaxID=199890 RepID=A0A182PR89_9DIPT